MGEGQGMQHSTSGPCPKQSFPETPHLNHLSLSPPVQLCPCISKKEFGTYLGGSHRLKQVLKELLLEYLWDLTQFPYFRDAWLIPSECLKTRAQASLWFLHIQSSPTMRNIRPGEGSNDTPVAVQP